MSCTVPRRSSQSPTSTTAVEGKNRPKRLSQTRTTKTTPTVPWNPVGAAPAGQRPSGVSGVPGGPDRPGPGPRGAGGGGPRRRLGGALGGWPGLGGGPGGVRRLGEAQPVDGLLGQVLRGGGGEETEHGDAQHQQGEQRQEARQRDGQGQLPAVELLVTALHGEGESGRAPAPLGEALALADGPDLQDLDPVDEV